MCPVALGRLIEHMSHSLNFDPIQMQIWEMTKGETETGTQFYVGRSTMEPKDSQRRNWILIRALEKESVNIVERLWECHIHSTSIQSKCRSGRWQKGRQRRGLSSMLADPQWSQRIHKGAIEFLLEPLRRSRLILWKGCENVTFTQLRSNPNADLGDDDDKRGDRDGDSVLCWQIHNGAKGFT